MTIVEFLTAQLDERQREADAAADGGDGQWAAGTHPADECRIEGDQITIYDEGGHSAEQARFIAANDPAFVLADIAAKRRIIELHQPTDIGFGPDVIGCAVCHDMDPSTTWGPDLLAPGQSLWPCETVQLFALPFADRPGYDEAWRP